MTTQRGGGSFDFNVFSGGSTNASVVGKTIHHSSVPLAVSALPPSPAGFTGRAVDLARLLTFLDPHVTTDLPVLVCSVSGLGGIGKTALALQAAHQAVAKGWFPGGAIFVDLRGYDEPVTADQAVVALLSALGVQGRELPPEPSSQFALYRSLLAERSPVLLIFDNASAPQQITPLLPGRGRHRVLVTSRDRFVELEARLVDLAPLEPKEAVALLTKALHLRDPDDPRPSGEPESLRELALLCGGHPLALSISAAMLARRRNRTVALLVEELSESHDRVDVMGLRQVFRSFYQRLAPELARVLRLLALAPTPETGTAAAAAMTGLPERETGQFLGGLAEASLVVPVRGSWLGEERWRFHNLVRDHAASLTSPEDEEGKSARRRVLAFYAERSQAAFDWLGDWPTDRHNGFDGREHAEVWLKEERPNLVAAAEWAEDEQYAPMSLAIALNVVPYLTENGYLDDALAVSCTARLVAHRSGAKAAEARAWGNLGIVLSSMGRLAEAVEAFTRASALAQTVGNRPSEAVSWDNLGIALHEAGRTEEAIDAHTRARDLYEETGDRFREAGVWNNLGIALRDAGRLEDATDAFVRSRDFMQEVGHTVGEADVWNNLGIILHRTGRTQEAVEALTRAIELRRDLGDSYGEGNALRNLALALSSTDDSAARGCWGQAADAYEHANAVTEAAHARFQAESSR
ncbi:tetratricopeptide repeat protein [Streptomyces prunicolor]|jgi:tetratricopeptide (TPR) repeat protein|uniref:tetratricopeptide repeat protein n=1 Tax=Streptomyces prunicolor TaxID=67348 RepID=UPI0003A9CF90|nr:tetratricopeptide repeat protein [Streptomyces prunicolor]